MTNSCLFSACRQYRYELVHRIEEVAPHAEHGDTFLPWIGLNPSTADEQNLDPTLRRVRRFTAEAGFNHFVMLNLFAFRSTDPVALQHAMNPVGWDNDATIRKWAEKSQFVVCAWGSHHGHISRWRKVVEMVSAAGAQLYALGTNLDGQPKHPLYLKAETVMTPWVPPREIIEEPWMARKRKKALQRIARRK